MLCYFCKSDLRSLVQADRSISRREECPHCGCDVHICRNCRFYDESAHNQCRETQAERVTDKEKANFCDYFRPSMIRGGDKDSGKAKKAFDNLFRS